MFNFCRGHPRSREGHWPRSLPLLKVRFPGSISCNISKESARKQEFISVAENSIYFHMHTKPNDKLIRVKSHYDKYYYSQYTSLYHLLTGSHTSNTEKIKLSLWYGNGMEQNLRVIAMVWYVATLNVKITLNVKNFTLRVND